MNINKKPRGDREALREAVDLMRVMQEHLRAADNLAKAASIVSMYARINHPHLGDYSEVIDPPLKAYQALREPCAAWKEKP